MGRRSSGESQETCQFVKENSRAFLGIKDGGSVRINNCFNTFAVKRNVLLSIVCMLFSSHLLAQVAISGRIVDAQTERPVVGAYVRVDKSMQKAVSNSKGEFQLTGLSDGAHVLSVTHISYEPRTERVEGSKHGLLLKMKESNLNVGQVVVTGTGTHHRLKDSPVPVHVLTQREIANANATTIEEALQILSPSFTTMTNGMGTFLNFNGLSDDYFVFLLNGRRMAGDDVFRRINVNNIKRIELLNGASSTLYGTNALGGVINIITDDAKNTLSVRSDTKVRSKKRSSESINVDVQKDKIGSYTSYQYETSDCWQLSPYEEQKGELVETNKIASTGYHTNQVTERLTFDANDRLSFYAEGNYYRNKTDRPFDVYAYDVDHENYGYGVGAKWLLKGGNYLTADFNTDIFNSSYDYYKKSGTIEAGTDVLRKRTRYHNAALKGIFNLGKINKLSVGTEFVFDALKSVSDNINKETDNTIALFAQDEVKILSQLKALVGVRYLHHNVFGSYATPTASVMYTLGDLNLRANYSAGYKAPTLSEIYATDIAKTTDRMTIGNENLKSEKSNFFGFNAEYNYRWFSVSGNVFLNKVRDMIDYATIATGEKAMQEYGHKTVRQRQNINRAKVLGVNVNANAYLGYGFSVRGGFSYLDAKDEETEKPLDKTIKNAWTVGAQWAKNWGIYSLHVALNGRIYSRRYSESYGYAPHYNMWDLTTRHSIQLNQFTLEPGFGVENIFNWTDDRPYNSNYATLNPGRTVYVSLKLLFKN